MKPCDQLKLPLRTPLILFTAAGMFSCRVVYGGPDYLVCVDVARVYEDGDGLWLGTEAALGGKVTFARDAVVGFRALARTCEHENEEAAARQMAAETEAFWVALRRSQFRLVVDQDRPAPGADEGSRARAQVSERPNLTVVVPGGPKAQQKGEPA